MITLNEHVERIRLSGYSAYSDFDIHGWSRLKSLLEAHVRLGHKAVIELDRYGFVTITELPA